MKQVFRSVITGASLLLGSLMLLSCGGAKNEGHATGGEKSYLRTRDDISKNIRNYFEEVSKENIAFAETFYGDEVEVWVNDIVVNGKEAYVDRLNRIHKVLLKDMTVEKLHVHTNYFSPEALTMDGKTVGEMNPGEETIWSNAWAIVKATGRVTGEEITFRMHMDFRTSKGKVVEMLAFYDPSQLNAEIAALEASEAPEEKAAE
ncbi:MAG: hypothetical protein VYC57_03205 [Verrucomicrobiota bacterium]|nr:hypothetical protein [Verrucomicrobiota bacterium]